MPTVESGFREGLTAGRSDVRLGIKFDEFSAMLRELKAKLGDGVVMRQVIDSEVARVLEMAIKNTGKADASKIKKRIEGRKVFKVGGKTYGYNGRSGKRWRVPDGVWGDMTNISKRSLDRTLAKIGLSKQSWLLVAQRAGLDLKNVPDYVYLARVTVGNPPANVDVTRSGTGGSYGIEILNKMPILRFDPPGGTQALFSAIVGRARFFQRNVAEGVFDSVATIAAKYPGIRAPITRGIAEGDMPI